MKRIIEAFRHVEEVWEGKRAAPVVAEFSDGGLALSMQIPVRCGQCGRVEITAIIGTACARCGAQELRRK